MAAISMYLEQAQLSLAAYAEELTPGITGAGYIDKLQAAGMSSVQATQFAARFSVVDQFTDPIFSGTVFESNGAYYFAMRGTEGLFSFAGAIDWLANVADIGGDGIAITHGLVMFNWLQRLYGLPNTAVVQYVFNPLTGTLDTFTGTASGYLYGSSSPISVAGHSLGGHLAMMMSRLAPGIFDAAYTYNAPGFDVFGTGLTSESFFNLLRNASIAPVTGPIGASWNSSIMVHSNVEGDVVHDIGTAPGIAGLVFTERERQGVLDAHGIVPLTDSLAVYDLFAGIAPTVDPAVGMVKIAEILKATSPEANSSLERAVDALTDLFKLDFPPLAINVGDRNALYERVFELKGILPSNPSLVIESLSKLLPEDMASIAQGSTAFGYRYALRELVPFAILGDNSIYDLHNENGALDLYDPVSRTGALNEDWIRDRAGLLQAVLTANTQDNPDIARIPGSGDISTTYHYYSDGKERLVFADPIDRLPGQQREQTVMFADDTGRALVGTDNLLGDRLYGGANTDYLIGRSNDDTLEGGKGLDIYEYGTSSAMNDGADTILDTDGKGVIRYTVTQGGIFSSTVHGTVIADATVQVSGLQWNSADGKFSYIRSGDDLVVTINGDVGGTITLKDFRDGDFSIRLWDARAEPPISGVTISGDLEPQDFDPNTPGIQTQTDEFGNVIVTTNPEPDRADVLNDSAGGDRIVAGGGNDVVRGIRGGDDWMSGDAGRDNLAGGAGADLIEGGADGVYSAEAGGDIAFGDAGNDALYADGKIPLAQAIALGNSGAASGSKGEYLSGGSGEDWIVGAAGNDYLDGGGGRDLIIGGAGDDNITGDYGYVATTPLWVINREITQQGNVTLHTLNFVSGSVSGLDGEAGAADVVYAGSGADWIPAGDGDDFVDAGPGDDRIWGEAGSDVLIGGEGNDLLVGDNPTIITGAAEGADYLDGGAGDDKLEGDGGNDVLIGATGTDTLSGGAGKDIYVFNKGDGTDWVVDTDTDPSNPDASVLVLGDGVSSSAIKFRTGSLAVDLGPSDTSDPASPHDAIHFAGFDQIDPVASRPLAEIRFADGANMSYDDVLARGFDIDGTEADDTGVQNLVGTGVADRIRGFGGNDLLFGFRGDDMLDGGDGADQLLGGPGIDTVYGGVGDDEIWGDAESGGIFAPDGADLVYAGAGNDIVQGNGGGDELFGEDDSDTLYGDDGADVLDGGAGDDYLYGQGYFFVGGIPYLNLFDDGASDTLRGGDGNDYLNAAAGDDVLEGGDGDDNLEGEAGADYLAGGDGNDLLWGDRTDSTPAGADTLDGGAGNDQLVGYAGNDTYVFGRGYGQDVVFDSDATPGNVDRVVFAADIAPDDVSAVQSGPNLILTINGTTDTLTLANQVASAADRIEEIRFADGTVWAPGTTPLTIRGTPGHDVLQGTSGPDVIEGLAGNDTMSGAGGNDTYRISLGDGADVITDFDATAGNLDRLVYAADILPSDIQISRSGLNLVLRRIGSTDQVTISNYFSNDGATPYSVEQIKFLSDGTIWDVATIKSMLLNGTSGNDVITGYASADTLAGLAGNDTLNGNAGDDTLDGGAGNDLLQGGSGNDTYLFARLHGQDTITDVDATAGNIDTIAYAPDIVHSDVQATRAGNDLVLKLTGTTDQVVVTGYFQNDGASTSLVERVEFADNTMWNLAAIKSLVVTPTDGPDAITGYASDDNLSGLAGNDTIRGAAGNDTLSGGADNDFLSGDGGADTYLFARGGGLDTIDNASSDGGGTLDALLFAADILPADIIPSRDGRNLVLTIQGSADQVRIQDYFSSGTNVVEEIRFADGTIWNEQTILALLPPPALVGTEVNDLLLGTPAGELIRGLGGDDTLRGLGGNDTFEGGPGMDTVIGGAGDDTYLFNIGDGGPPSFFILGDDMSDAGGYDILQFGSGIAPSGFFIDEGTDSRGHMLVLSPEGTNAGVYIIGYFGTGHIEEIRFEDGTVWTDQSIAPLFPRNGTSGNDNMIGTMIADVMDGSAGNDTINGGSGHDTLDGGLGSDRLLGATGNDSLFGGEAADELLGGDGNDTLNGGLGGDTLMGEAGDDLLIAGAGEAKNANVSNFLHGGSGNDILVASGKGDLLSGEAGDDIVLGAAGNDVLYGGEGSNLLFGAGGAEVVYLGDHNDLVIGGSGIDVLEGDGDANGIRGRDIVLFNKSDGTDVVSALGGGSTLSIGGGTVYGNLSLEVDGNTLRLKTGSSHYVALTDWYAGNQSVSTLQIVLDGSRDYKPTSSNPMNNQKIQVFDFLGLVDAFDAARAAGQRFNVSANLADHRLWGSDTEAIGGALAYQYAMTGSIASLSYEQMRAVISQAEFGVAAQPIGAAASAAAAEMSGGDELMASFTLAAFDDGAGGEGSVEAEAEVVLRESDTTMHRPLLPDQATLHASPRVLATPAPFLNPSSPDAFARAEARSSFARSMEASDSFSAASAVPMADDIEASLAALATQGDGVRSVQARVSGEHGVAPDARDPFAEWFERGPLDDDLTLLDDIARGELAESTSRSGDAIARAWRRSHGWLNSRLYRDGADSDGLADGFPTYTLFGDSGGFADLPRPTVGLRNVSGHELKTFAGLREGASVLSQWTGSAL